MALRGLNPAVKTSRAALSSPQSLSQLVVASAGGKRKLKSPGGTIEPAHAQALSSGTAHGNVAQAFPATFAGKA